MRRRFLAVVLVLGLLLGVVLPLEFMFSGPPPVSVDPGFKPTVRVPAGVDVDGNRIDDRLDLEIAQRVSNGTQGESVNVVVMLSDGVGEKVAAGAFAAAGGSVIAGLWRYALYGFGGRIPFGRVAAFVKSRSDVLLVEKEAECNASVAYAAQQVGARPYVWSTLGLRGDSNSSVAVLDTGVDGSHVDFAPGFGAEDFSRKIVGWSDQVGVSSVPYDDNGHGSHCAGLAAGDGFFSVYESGLAEGTFGADYGGLASGSYLAAGMMVNQTGTITVSVRWANTINGKLNSLTLYYGDKSLSTGSWTPLTSVSTSNANSWYTLSYNIMSVPSSGYDMYHLVASISKGVSHLYVMFNMSWPYMPPEDGFSAWTGLAPDSKLVGVKVLDSSGGGTSTGLIDGLNWVIANRVALHITVASMSLGFTSEVSTVDVAVLNLVNSGVCTIVAAGNDGSGANNIYTPGSVDEVLTVAAMNQFDGIASYSSQGGTSRYTGQTVKPDVTAPGGSFVGVPLFSVDSNYNDAEGGWSDAVANDSAPMQGTSMATPVVAGAAQTLVEALGGFAGWNYTRDQALMPKMLLLMTATETYPNARESGASPTLERGDKDVQEGYGRINVDAAADAVLKTYWTGTTVVDSLGSPPSLSDISVVGERLAWARNIQLVSGVSYNFSLSVPAGADYDLYLYDTTGNAFGEPVILTKSTTAGVGVNESVAYTPVLSGEYFVVVKRAREDTGDGQFILSSTPSQAVHLLLNVEPQQATFQGGQLVSFAVTVFNQLSPALGATLTLTVTGPDGYYLYDFQSIAVVADDVKDYSFSWVVPDAAGTYVVEVGLVPVQLTAYDSAWLQVS